MPYLAGFDRIVREYGRVRKSNHGDLSLSLSARIREFIMIIIDGFMRCNTNCYL